MLTNICHAGSDHRNLVNTETYKRCVVAAAVDNSILLQQIADIHLSHMS